MRDDIVTIIETALSLRTSPPFFEACNTILIYGAGNMGKDVLHAMNSRGIKVAGSWIGTQRYRSDATAYKCTRQIGTA